MFNKEKQCGVKKKNIPSPRIIDFHKSSSYEDIINKGRSVFFENESDDLTCYSLCGPSGFPFEIASRWVLEEFMKHHGFQPSKLRLYIMYTSSEPAYVEVSIINQTCMHLQLTAYCLYFRAKTSL